MVAHTILRINGYYLSRHDEDEILALLHKISDAEVDCDLELIERWVKRKSRSWWRMTQSSLSNYL